MPCELYFNYLGFLGFATYLAHAKTAFLCVNWRELLRRKISRLLIPIVKRRCDQQCKTVLVAAGWVKCFNLQGCCKKRGKSQGNIKKTNTDIYGFLGGNVTRWHSKKGGPVPILLLCNTYMVVAARCSGPLILSNTHAVAWTMIAA